TAAAHFVAPHYRDIILQVTTYDTRAATCTGIEIDGHDPLVARLLVLVPHIVGFMRIGPPAGIVGRILLVFGKTCFTDNVTAFDGMVGLGLRQLVRASGLRQLGRGVVLHGTVL